MEEAIWDSQWRLARKENRFAALLDSCKSNYQKMG
ncbi:hypothetical protein SAMN05216233_11866 [Desulfoluna spongiiphila]|uniref:Uncharacterized protein n=1 Tax=Desulfoluna spongiiphila TaxID=419481 RepID=A0A1G5I9J0_9BACT|nr:hypothetical protein SAMN05216233_11866 [Desulfoluna spongiiphila]VVS93196.1 hypothetical protein DBB_27640 [Desulfoluna spongiiphila]